MHASCDSLKTHPQACIVLHLQIILTLRVQENGGQAPLDGKV
ncbi:hypothetical protein NMG60_11003513 [Bertholletia excelsa]